MAAKKKIQERMAAKKKSGFPFKTLSLLITLIIGGVVYCDINEHGSWKDSRIRAGLCVYSHKTLEVISERYQLADSYVHQNYPEYHATLHRWASEFSQLFKDLGLILYNVVFVNIKNVFVEKYPVFVQSIESYAPGLLEQSQKTVNNVWSTSILYVRSSVDYLKTEVFIGQLSPENMQRVVIEAFNTTQQKATEYYHWIYEKVQTTIK